MTDPAQLDQDFFDVLTAGDAGRLGELLTDDFLIVDINSGSVATKADLVGAVTSGALTFPAIEALPAEAVAPRYCDVAVHLRPPRVHFPTHDRADADRAGAEIPPVVVDRHDVVELEPGAAGSRTQPQLDPAHAAVVLPGRREAVRRVARLDRPARVAGELVPAVQPQLTGDGQEPAGDPVGVGTRVPHVVDSSVVRLRDRDGTGLTGGDQPAADAPIHGVDLCGDV